MVDISVNNLTKFFVIGENLLQGLSFEIQEGERVAILGFIPFILRHSLSLALLGSSLREGAGGHFVPAGG